MASLRRRFDPNASRRPSYDHGPSRLFSLPPSVSRRRPVPSGCTRYTCSFMPPPGATLKASQAPSGDHWTPPTASSSAVTSSGQPPSALTVQICGTPFMLETNAIRLPSGEKLGAEQLEILAMSATVRSRSRDPEGSAAAIVDRDANAIATNKHRAACRMSDLQERLFRA